MTDYRFLGVPLVRNSVTIGGTVCPRQKIFELRSQGHTLKEVATLSETTVAIVRGIVGKADGGQVKRERQEVTAKTIEGEGGTWAEQVAKWKAATGQSEATYWRVLKRQGN